LCWILTVVYTYVLGEVGMTYLLSRTKRNLPWGGCGQKSTSQPPNIVVGFNPHRPVRIFIPERKERPTHTRNKSIRGLGVKKRFVYLPHRAKKKNQHKHTHMSVSFNASNTTFENQINFTTKVRTGRPVDPTSKRQQRLNSAPGVRTGRPINPDSKRQQRLATQAQRIAQGGEVKRGRPVNPTSKRQMAIAERQALLDAGVVIKRGRPAKKENQPTT